MVLSLESLWEVYSSLQSKSPDQEHKELMLLFTEKEKNKKFVIINWEESSGARKRIIYM